MSGLLPQSEYLRAHSAQELAAQIVDRHGPMLKLADVWQVLGYPSADAARKAAARKRAPVDFVTIEGRRGRFARAADLAAFLFKGLKQDSDPN